MKIIRNTPEQLIVANQPWVLGTALILLILMFVAVGVMIALQDPLFGIPFALFGGGIGGLCFVAFVRRVQVIFDRPRNQIRIQKRSLYSASETTHPLSQLRRAVLETTVSSMNHGNANLYRPALELDGKRQPMITSYTSTRGPARLVNAINTWLDAPPLDSALLDSGSDQA